MCLDAPMMTMLASICDKSFFSQFYLCACTVLLVYSDTDRMTPMKETPREQIGASLSRDIPTGLDDTGCTLHAFMKWGKRNWSWCRLLVDSRTQIRDVMCTYYWFVEGWGVYNNDTFCFVVQSSVAKSFRNHFTFKNNTTLPCISSLPSPFCVWAALFWVSKIFQVCVAILGLLWSVINCHVLPQARMALHLSPRLWSWADMTRTTLPLPSSLTWQTIPPPAMPSRTTRFPSGSVLGHTW